MTDDELEGTIARLRRQGSDDAEVEVKASAGGLPKSIWSSVSAFANTRGGTVILGLDEDSNFQPASGFNPQKILDVLSSGLDELPGTTPRVRPVPGHRIQRAELEGAPLVIAEIDSLRGIAGVEMPCHVTSLGVQKGSFKRVDDKDKRLTTYEIYLLQTAIRPVGVDREPVTGASPDDLSDDLVTRTLARQRRLGSHVLDGVTDRPDEALRRLNIVTAKGIPTVAGYLTLASYPQVEFPQLFIDVAVHPGTEKSLDRTLRFIDRQVCDGPLPSAIDDAVRAVLRNLRTRHVVVGVGGEDSPEIPEAVLREAITNAVTHRDYSDYVRGQQVSVDVFTDRVEVTNPGGFWGDRTPENVIDGRSSSRNEALAKLLTIVPRNQGEGAVCENQGSGVPRMVHAMREEGLPLPDYSQSDIGHVTVILHRFGLLDPETRAWLDTVGGAPRTIVEDSALALVRRDTTVDVDTLRRSLGIDSDDARRTLFALASDHVLDGQGDGPYVLAVLEAGSGRLSQTQRSVLAVLNETSEQTVHDIARLTDRSPNSLRPILRGLVERGLAVATAPPTSKKRAYRRAAGGSRPPG